MTYHGWLHTICRSLMWTSSNYNWQINQIHNLWKFAEDTILQTWMIVKTQYNHGALHNLQSHLAYRYNNMCVLIRHSFYETLVIICLTKHKGRSFLSDIGQCCRSGMLFLVILNFLVNIQKSSIPLSWRNFRICSL